MLGRTEALHRSCKPTDYGHFQVQPLSGVVGAEITGLDLRDHLSDDVMAAVRQALLDWGVVFFYDQDITTEDHVRFAGWFGELEVHPFVKQKDGFPEVLVLEHDKHHPARENLWHSDVTWRLEPSLGSVLRGIEVPTFGGDTLFANMAQAYAKLSDDVKEKIDGKRARHSAEAFLRGLKASGASDEAVQAYRERYPNPEHPVVRTHPETGEKSIYVNIAFTEEIVGMDPAESRTLLKHLYQQAWNPDIQCRFRWRKNAIAFWDNRAVQHYAAADYYPERRVVERVTVCGDTPR